MGTYANFAFNRIQNVELIAAKKAEKILLQFKTTDKENGKNNSIVNAEEIKDIKNPVLICFINIPLFFFDFLKIQQKAGKIKKL